MAAPDPVVNVVRQRHPSVPSSNNPPIPEWSNHYWYMLRCAALQAQPGLDDNAVAHLVNFFASMAVVIPCPECRGHFVEDFEAEPFTAAHAKDHTKAMAWVEDLRIKVERRVAAKMGKATAQDLTATHLGPRYGGMAVAAEVAAADAAAEAAEAAAAARAAQAAPPSMAGAGAGYPTKAAGAVAGYPPKPAPLIGSRGPQLYRHPATRGALRLAGPVPAPAPVPAAPMGAVPVVRAAVESNPASAPLRGLAIRAAMQTTRANHAGHRIGCNCGKNAKK